MKNSFFFGVLGFCALLAACQNTPPALPTVDPAGSTRQGKSASLLGNEHLPALFAHCENQKKHIALLQNQLQTSLHDERERRREPMSGLSAPLFDMYAIWLKSCPDAQNLPTEEQYKQWLSDSKRLQASIIQCAKDASGVQNKAKWLQFIEIAENYDFSGTFPDFETLKNSDKPQAFALLALAESSILQLLQEYYGEVYAYLYALDLKFDSFVLLSQPDKTHLTLGEEFSTSLQLATYSSGAKTTLNVNAENVEMKEGVGSYIFTPKEAGNKQFSIKAKIINPFTGEESYALQELKVPVIVQGDLSAGIKPVVYTMVDNPLTIYPPDARVSVSGAGSTISGKNGDYILRVKEAGSVKLSVLGTDGSKLMELNFFAQNLPNPMATIGGQKGGTMSANAMRAQMGIITTLENFEYDAKCLIASFTLFYTPKGKESIELKGSSPRFEGAVRDAVLKAASGDLFVFQELKASCPGDVVPRSLNSLPILIK